MCLVAWPVCLVARPLDKSEAGIDIEFLVSKETVVLRRWRDENKNLGLSNELIKVELPP